MSRRSGQTGYIEKKGNAFYCRFRIDVPGQDKREYRCVRICPAIGLGSMTKQERKRRAKEIIAESGADSERHFNKVEAVNLGVTFRQQAAWFLDHVKTRKRKPVKPATATSWTSHLAWINRVLGDMPLASVNNSALKELVSKMAEENFSPKTMHNYSYVVKAVVASAVNEQGEKIYPREWSHEFIDLPVVIKQNQRTPEFTAEEVAAIALAAKGELRVLYSLLAGTGLRIGEALALEVSDISDCTIAVRQGVWNGVVQSPKTPSGVREVDVHSSLAAVLKAHIQGRQAGFVFQSPAGKPPCPSNIRNRSLHAILEAMGKEACGFHSFRRFRITHLRKNSAPEDLIRFWIGHADETVTDGYSKVKKDVGFRRLCAESLGLGFELPTQAQIQEPVGAPIAPMSEVVSIAL
jgi:integrase